MLISVSVVMVYTAVHSLILFVHVATLNVAMNSADEALRKFALCPAVSLHAVSSHPIVIAPKSGSTDWR